MRFVGIFVRTVLNINTIWGWMILIALLCAVYQQYTPTATFLPASAVHDGENTLVIRVTPRGGETREYAYVLSRTANVVTCAAADRERIAGPWMIACTPSTAATTADYRLTWDSDEHGLYEITLGGTPIDRGRLVTLQGLTAAAFDYAKIGFEVALGLVASMVLFLGLMRVGEAAGLVQLVARALRPLIHFLFPEVPRDHPAGGAIIMNWTTTLLGLGNAATPFGLKAMQELQKLNPHKHVASNAQVMLLGFNTAGLALLPTTLIAMRKAAGCSNPFEIIGTCLVAGLVATVTAIVMVKLLGALPFFSTRAAVADDPAEATTHAGAAGGGEDA